MMLPDYARRESVKRCDITERDYARAARALCYGGARQRRRLRARRC